MLSNEFLWPIVIIFLILPFIAHAILQLCKKLDCCGCLDKYFAKSVVERQVHYARWSAWITRIKYILLQIVVGLTFYTFPYSEFVKNVDNGEEIEFNVSFHIAQFLCVVLYLITSFIDPGIIPPSSLIIESREDPKETHGTKNESSPLIDTRFKYPFEPITISRSNPPVCFCWECKTIPPIRARHDYDCGTCVARFDHYDNWVGNAIAAYNHRYYVILLLFETFVFVTAFVLKFDILIHIISDDETKFVDPTGWFVIIFVLLYMFAVSVKTLPMFVYHIWIISKNKTTQEMIKPEFNMDLVKFIDGIDNCSEYNTERGEFDKGIWSNWKMLFNAFKYEPQYFYGLKCSVVDKDTDSTEV